MKRNSSGFTLIELVMIIVILGILAAVAIPKYFDLQAQAKKSAELGTVGGVRSGISTYYADQCRLTGGCLYPGALGGSGSCTNAAPCFANVLSQPVTTSDWSASGTAFTGPNGGVYTYTSGTGTFTCTSGACTAY